MSLAVVLAAALAAAAPAARALEAQNEVLFRALAEGHHLKPVEIDAVRAIFARSGFAGQGNPALARHALTPQECRSRAAAAGARFEDERFAAICGGPYMAPLYDPATQSIDDAKVCIDQFEFPDLPCEWPVVWIRAREAAEVCWAMGKRLCDAHEWEGACEGRLLPPDYRFDLAEGVAPAAAVRRMRAAHNQQWGPRRTWAYGPAYREGVCATGSFKSPGCAGGGWSACGSNTYPAGSFPACRSPLGVFDLNGNAAEHMNLPLAESELASRGSRSLGVTEMKGSWFIFDTYQAHEDWCRWRAPYWHGSRLMDAASHENYHLGFRCCKDVERPGD